MENNIRKINIVNKEELVIKLYKKSDLLLFATICDTLGFRWGGSMLGRTFFSVIGTNSESPFYKHFKRYGIYIRIHKGKLSWGSLCGTSEFIINMKGDDVVKFTPFESFYKMCVKLIKNVGYIKEFNLQYHINRKILKGL